MNIVSRTPYCASCFTANYSMTFQSRMEAVPYKKVHVLKPCSTFPVPPEQIGYCNVTYWHLRGIKAVKTRKICGRTGTRTIVITMNLAPARKAAFAALLAVDRGAWSAEALAAKSAHLDPRDGGLASDIVFGVLRRRGELDAVIREYSNRPAELLDPEIWIALEMALYQMRFLDRVPSHAAVNDAVELARRSGNAPAAAFVNAVLRQSLREPKEVPESLSTPKWLMDRWITRFGKEAAAGIAAASLQVPRRYIRTGAAAPPAGAEPTDVPGCHLLPTGDPGPFRFQDIGAQSVVPLLKLQAGETFLDVCASPGNKTAQALETDVHAVACDLHLSRARLVREQGIPVVTLDARQPLPFNRRFQKILLDAPCSGTGTLARNPEIKWKLEPDDFPDLQERQIAILRSALEQLEPGGLLVYSTCSLEREENEDVVAASGARIVETMQRIPGRDPGDGFFAAVLSLL
jgi:16S rRNA (cytosine967-C5)-methyltransferase